MNKIWVTYCLILVTITIGRGQSTITTNRLIDSLNNISYYYAISNINLDSAQILANSAKDSSLRKQYKKGEAIANYNLGIVAFQKDSIDKAYKIFKVSEAILIDEKENIELIKLYNGLAEVFNELELFDEAMDNYNKGLNVIRSISSRKEKDNCLLSYLQAGILYNMSEVYFNTYLKPIDTFDNKVLDTILNKVLYTLVKADSFATNGLTCVSNISGGIEEKHNISNRIKWIQGYISDLRGRCLCEKEKEYKAAFNSLKTGLEIRQDLNFYERKYELDLLTSNISLASCFNKKSKYDSAFIYLRKGIEKTSNIKDKNLKYEFYNELQKTYAGLARECSIQEKTRYCYNLLDSAYYYLAKVNILKTVSARKNSQKRSRILQFEQDNLEKEINKRKQMRGIIALCGLLVISLLITQLMREKGKRREIKKANQRLESALENATELSKLTTYVPSYETLYKKFIKDTYTRINRVIDASFFVFGLYEPEYERLYFPFAIENGEHFNKPIFYYLNEDYLATICFNKDLHREVLIKNYSKEWHKYLENRPNPKRGAKAESIIYVRIEFENNKIGVISVQSPKPNQYNIEDLNLMKLLANNLAISWTNVTAYSKIHFQEEQIREQKNKLEETNLLLRMFYAVIEHDVGNRIFPLIDELKNILNQEEIKIEREHIIRFQNRIIEAKTTLNNLMNWSEEEIVKLSEKSIYSVKKEAFLLKELEDSIISFNGEAEKKGIRFSVNFPDRIKILSNKTILIFIISNIVHNAIKFTKRGEVKIYTQNNKYGIDIIIEDTGPGIKKQNGSFNYLFSPHIDRSLIGDENENKGRGLGLVLTSKLAKLITLIINVESLPDKGSKFQISTINII